MSTSWIDPSISASLYSQFRGLMNEAQAAIELARASGFLPLADTLQEFKQFSQDYFQFFRDEQRFHHEQFRALEKIQREWLTFRPLLDQRNLPQLLTQLKATDMIANDCLTLGRVSIKLRHQVCFTYFEKAYSMARFVYARAPGLSVPLNSAYDPWLWMGLGHEMGHYVYWNQSNLKGQFEEAVTDALKSSEAAQDQLSPWKFWLEEIFADLFGTLIFGPASIESLMFWLRQRTTAEKVFENNGVHPVALLRPLIQIAALRMVDSTVPSTMDLDQIEREWLDYWTQPIPNGQGLQDWRDRPINQSRIGDCEELIPIVVKAAIDAMLKAQKITFYTGVQHQKIRDWSKSLVMDAQLALTDLGHPAYSLPVAWYAWKEIALDQSLSDEARYDRLSTIRKWIVESAPHSLAKKTEIVISEEATFTHWRKSFDANTDKVFEKMLANELSVAEDLGSQREICQNPSTCQKSTTTHYHN